MTYERRSWRPLLAIVTLLLLLFLLSSCTVGGGEDMLRYQEGITGASLAWEYGGARYEAAVTYTEKLPEDPQRIRGAVVEMDSPESISGMKLEYFSDGTTVSVGGVSFDLPQNMGREVYAVLRSLSLYPEEMRVKKNALSAEYVVNIDGADVTYTISYGADGAPLSAKIDFGDEDVAQVEYREIVRE